MASEPPVRGPGDPTGSVGKGAPVEPSGSASSGAANEPTSAKPSGPQPEPPLKPSIKGERPKVNDAFDTYDNSDLIKHQRQAIEDLKAQGVDVGDVKLPTDDQIARMSPKQQEAVLEELQNIGRQAANRAVDADRIVGDRHVDDVTNQGEPTLSAEGKHGQAQAPRWRNEFGSGKPVEGPTPEPTGWSDVNKLDPHYQQLLEASVRGKQAALDPAGYGSSPEYRQFAEKVANDYNTDPHFREMVERGKVRDVDFESNQINDAALPQEKALIRQMANAELPGDDALINQMLSEARQPAAKHELDPAVKAQLNRRSKATQDWDRKIMDQPERPLRDIRPPERSPSTNAPNDAPTQKLGFQDRLTERLNPREGATQRLAPDELPTQRTGPAERPTERYGPGDKPTQPMDPTERPTERYSPGEQPTQRMEPSERPTERYGPSDQPTQRMEPGERPTERYGPDDQPTQRLGLRDRLTERLNPREGATRRLTPDELPTQRTGPAEQPTERYGPGDKPTGGPGRTQHLSPDELPQPEGPGHTQRLRPDELPQPEGPGHTQHLRPDELPQPEGPGHTERLHPDELPRAEGSGSTERLRPEELPRQSRPLEEPGNQQAVGPKDETRELPAQKAATAREETARYTPEEIERQELATEKARLDKLRNEMVDAMKRREAAVEKAQKDDLNRAPAERGHRVDRVREQTGEEPRQIEDRAKRERSLLGTPDSPDSAEVNIKSAEHQLEALASGEGRRLGLNDPPSPKQVSRLYKQYRDAVDQMKSGPARHGEDFWSKMPAEQAEFLKGHVDNPRSLESWVEKIMGPRSKPGARQAAGTDEVFDQWPPPGPPKPAPEPAVHGSTPDNPPVGPRPRGGPDPFDAVDKWSGDQAHPLDADPRAPAAVAPAHVPAEPPAAPPPEGGFGIEPAGDPHHTAKLGEWLEPPTTAIEPVRHGVKLNGAEAMLRDATGFDARTGRAAASGIGRGLEHNQPGRHQLVDHAYNQYESALKAVREGAARDPNYWEKMPAPTRETLLQQLAKPLPPRSFFHDLIKRLGE